MMLPCALRTFTTRSLSLSLPVIFCSLFSSQPSLSFSSPYAPAQPPPPLFPSLTPIISFFLFFGSLFNDYICMSSAAHSLHLSQTVSTPSLIFPPRPPICERAADLQNFPDSTIRCPCRRLPPSAPSLLLPSLSPLSGLDVLPPAFLSSSLALQFCF